MVKIFVDRGGTFTDIIAVTDNREIINNIPTDNQRFCVFNLPNDQWIILYKLLSENPERYQDAVIQGIRDILGVKGNDTLDTKQLEVVKMGTTVATNALLERKGDRTVLVITKGFKDALKIGYQNRPNIFDLKITLPSMLYESVIEVDARYDVNGNELKAVDTEQVYQDLKQVYEQGIRSCAIVFMHSFRYPDHENKVSQIAQEIGFTQVSVSHQVSPLMKLVARGDTTVVDAYLSPILRRYIDQVLSQLPDVRLMFMKSDGGLADADQFHGKDSILSGPAGGIVGAVQTSLRAGFKEIITFDMGGTSTDVAHFNGEYERQIDNEIAGTRIRVPMLSIHTVAAGGGSILFFDGFSFRVGPESAGANPGPACYRRGGPLTVTDANVMVGKIRPNYFPAIFGEAENLPLDQAIVKQKFTELAQEVSTVTGNLTSPEKVANGFILIAVQNMANAIKKVSLQKGYDVTKYALTSFGGAGGQVCCLIADTLGIKTIFLHPYAGVLSAYGMGLADICVIQEKAVEQLLTLSLIKQLNPLINQLEIEAKNKLNNQTVQSHKKVNKKVNLKYQGTDSTLLIDLTDDPTIMIKVFEEEHRSRYGFIQSNKPLIVESISVEVIEQMETPEEALISRIRPLSESPKPLETVEIFTHDTWYNTPIYRREDLQTQDRIEGPAIIVEKISTIIVEPNWKARLTEYNHLILHRD
ncbi:5-oxoprolinase (ATP-hydrolyzing) [Rippkaea orientalis PCC 8801]|uniref:5-oxoprolinase (ATP-hydrolyzing) n=1 Tax=Rippkaea orientalis (strain PCC 8801 / RF-1) TaxID=41431 RepID=B7K3F7_RIPO1|nr:hydantoinase/oxoprolinase family protein [Rippkaea orientalis]ACK65299.1 5-oxoprolinase (ATP-hydrolyzing) [Rippkaea orientalis PCC 8801]